MASGQHSICLVHSKQSTAERVLSSIPMVLDMIMFHIPTCYLHQCALVCKTWNKAVQRRHKKILYWTVANEDFLQKINYPTELTIIFKSISCENSSVSMKNSTNYHDQTVELNSNSVMLCDSVRCFSSDYRSETFPYLVIPKLPNVHVYVFCPSSSDGIGLDENVTRPQLCQFTGIPEKEDCKLLIMFSRDIESGVGCHFDFPTMFKHVYRNVIIGGCYTGDLCHKLSMSDSQHIVTVGSPMYLAFCGSNVKVASLSLKNLGYLRDKAGYRWSDIEDDLCRIKQYNMPQGNSFIFLFSSCPSDVEVKTIENHFPETPIFQIEQEDVFCEKGPPMHGDTDTDNGQDNDGSFCYFDEQSVKHVAYFISFG